MFIGIRVTIQKKILEFFCRDRGLVYSKKLQEIYFQATLLSLIFSSSFRSHFIDVFLNQGRMTKEKTSFFALTFFFQVLQKVFFGWPLGLLKMHGRFLFKFCLFSKVHSFKSSKHFFVQLKYSESTIETLKNYHSWSVLSAYSRRNTVLNVVDLYWKLGYNSRTTEDRNVYWKIGSR